MQTKSIAKIISSKVYDWIASINDTTLREDLKKSILVSGGSITSLFLGEQVNDYDIYLQDRKVLLELANYYTKGIGSIRIFDGEKKAEIVEKERGIYDANDFLAHSSNISSSLRNLKDDQIKIYIEGGGGYKCDLKVDDKGEAFKYQPVYFSPNAISLTDDIQIVVRFWGTPYEIHKTFDFIHATNYFTIQSGVVLNKEALESLLTKQLKYQGSHYPVTSVIRAKKFVKRGFNITAGELLKMMFQISLLDLTNMDVLEEQLIGVDVAYFETLINALRASIEADKGFKITPDHFNNLIDKIFNHHIDEE